MQKRAFEIKIIHGTSEPVAILGSLVFVLGAQKEPDIAPPETEFKQAKQIAFVPFGVNSFKWFEWEDGCAYRIWVQTIAANGRVEDKASSSVAKV